MTKLKRYLTSISVYYSLIYPFLNYGCILWGNNYDAPLSKVVKLQNKAIRIINDVPLMEPITPHYVVLNLLKHPDIVKLNTCLLFYDYLRDDKTPSFSLTLSSEQHSYNTRGTSFDQLVIESFRTNLGKCSPGISGKYFWNNIRNKSSKNAFKSALKRYYAAQY